MPKPIIGDIILLFVTLCWGLSFPFIGNAVDTTDPMVFVTVRFFVRLYFYGQLFFLHQQNIQKLCF